MPKVLKRPQAEVDLVDIWAFISGDSPAAADRFLDWLASRFELLAFQPHMGRARSEVRDNLRSFRAGSYSIFYTPIDDGIVVERVLHAAQDVDVIFKHSTGGS